ncbi:MAG TPA: D-alanyl-D-alanine carboxypeptidase family protein [Candidatus Krumholzibacteria bacterium]|nr:D-alanyl-D-alanine carboxypeptidase family protein [Candidatus Krumholzibacteria bacterium]
MLVKELRRSVRSVAPVVLVAALLPAVLSARAAEPATLKGDFASAIVIDAGTGVTLVAVNERAKRQPASMIKMLTELIVLERIDRGDISLDDQVTVSAKASRMGGSQVYLAHNEQFTVLELLEALAIHSANDAACALAEYVAGSTDAFVDLMNLRARELGMTDSEFHSVHGLPAGRGQQPDITSARDMAILGREVAKHPRALEWSSTTEMPFRDGKFTLHNPNKLVGKFRGLDGIKTGYTEPAGWCVTASAVQMGTRLISVVMGCPTDKDRANETTRLLTYGFSLYTELPVLAAGAAPEGPALAVRGGKAKEAPVAAAEALVVNVPRDRTGDVTVEVHLPEAADAPLAAGTEVGEAVALLDGIELGRVPMVVTQDVAKGNWLDRLFR